MSYVFDSLSKKAGLPKNAYLLQPSLKLDRFPAGLVISTPFFSKKNGIVKIRVFVILKLYNEGLREGGTICSFILRY